METKIDDCGNYLKITLEGRLVAAFAEDFKEEIMSKIEAKPNLLFDLSQMTHIDSSGLGALVQVLQKTKSLNGTTRLACLQPHPKIVFDITKVYRVFEIYDTVEQAANAFA